MTNIDNEIISVVKKITNKIADYKPEMFGQIEE